MGKLTFHANTVTLRVVVAISILSDFLFLGITEVHAHSTLYAKPSAIGNGDCMNWDDACTLQEALELAASGDEIWVAKGVHYPGTTRDSFFAMESGVKVYGGFLGTEMQISDRDWIANPTVLSGDVDHNDTLKDTNGIVTNVAGIQGSNAYQILSAWSVDNTAVFDGFIINAGKADRNHDYYKGSGVNLIMSSPTLSNLVICANSADYNGAGLYNNYGSPTITNVAFRGNKVVDPGAGGGMYNTGGNPTLSNVLFSGNYAYYGGGFASQSGLPTLINATFSGNRAFDGGALFVWNNTTTVVNAIIWGNSSSITINGGVVTVTDSIVQLAYQGNLVADPLFVDPKPYADAPTTLGEFHVRSDSPAIDSGNNTPVTTTTDLNRDPRITDGDGNGSSIVDMGAYEWTPYTLTVNKVGNGTVTKNPEQTEYGYGEEVTLTATADTDWSFVAWSGDFVLTNNPLIMTIKKNTTITANFRPILKLFLPLIMH